MKPIPTAFVVDDDGFMRELLGQVLTTAGILFRPFASAFDLLAGADLRSPCVLLLDVKMPGMSGPELQHVLRERCIDVPIIFLAGSSDVPVAVAAMRNGAVDFLEKPFDTATLVDRVRQVLARYELPAAPIPNPHYAQRLDTLTPREREVLDLMVTGQTSKRMARELGGSFRTIEIHRARVMTKMAAASLAELVRMNMGLDLGESG
jgi:FixJ family two-component response regulator